MRHLVAKYGREAVEAGMSGVLDYAEAQARDAFRTVPDGTYTFADYLEGDVVPGGRPIRIKLAMVVRDGDLTLDFSETDPQVRAALNIATYGQNGHYLIVIGIVSFLRSVNPEITYNSGIVRPVHLVVPKGSLLNPEPRASCGARQATFFRVAEVCMGALALAIPDRIPAAGCGQGSILFLAAPDFASGRNRVSIVQPLVGGSGARSMMDGTDGVDFNTGFYRNIPSEILESDMPVVVERYGLRPDSGGAGTYRGGAGLSYAMTILPPEAALTSRGMERYRFQPWGREGGDPGRNGATRLCSRDGQVEEIGKIDLLRPPPGSTIEIETAGGGGYGEPFSRDPSLVLHDVLDGLVSPSAARDEYGVVVSNGAVDLEATRALRASRLANGAPSRFSYGEYRDTFEARWPDWLQTAVNRATEGRPAAPRRYIRDLALAEIERRQTRGGDVSEAAVTDIVAQIVGTMEVSLLESL
jgi:N-methylhydantoinase B